VIDIGIDESAPSAQGTLVLSAMIGQTSKMKRLDRKWKADLERYNVAYFHAKEHWNRRSKAYSRISMQKRQELLSRLVGHIHKYSNVGLSVSIDPQEYADLTTPPFRSEWGSAYAFAIQMLIILVHFELKESEEKGRSHKNELANVLIEGGHKNTQQAFEIISKAVGKVGDDSAFIRVKSVGVGGKKDNPILQAADLLAYGWCQRISMGKSQMLDKLAGAGAPPEKFKALDLSVELVEMLKRDIDAHAQRRNDLRFKARKL